MWKLFGSAASRSTSGGSEDPTTWGTVGSASSHAPTSATGAGAEDMPVASFRGFSRYVRTERFEEGIPPRHMLLLSACPPDRGYYGVLGCVLKSNPPMSRSTPVVSLARFCVSFLLLLLAATVASWLRRLPLLELLRKVVPSCRRRRRVAVVGALWGSGRRLVPTKKKWNAT